VPTVGDDDSGGSREVVGDFGGVARRGDRIEFTGQHKHREAASNGFEATTIDGLNIPQVAGHAVEDEVLPDARICENGVVGVGGGWCVFGARVPR
jgi:hypothetical protein